MINDDSIYENLWGPDDIVWGHVYCPECMFPGSFMRQLRYRIQPWEALPLPEKIRFFNMRRENKPYDKCIAKQVTDENIVFESRKCYRLY